MAGGFQRGERDEAGVRAPELATSRRPTAVAGAPRRVASLLVGAADDPAERRADEVAGEVMRRIRSGGGPFSPSSGSPDGRIRRATSASGSDRGDSQVARRSGAHGSRIQRSANAADPLGGTKVNAEVAQSI